MLRYRFFRDFNDGYALLFDGTADDVRRLAALLESVAAGGLAGAIVLDDANGFYPERNTRVEIHVASEPADEATVTDEGDFLRAIWRLSPADAQSAAQHVRNVADSSEPCHTYLGEMGEIQIIVAQGEYDAAIFQT